MTPYRNASRTHRQRGRKISASHETIAAALVALKTTSQSNLPSFAVLTKLVVFDRSSLSFRWKEGVKLRSH